jgi:hypothetical protein
VIRSHGVIALSAFALVALEGSAFAFCRKTTCPTCPVDPATGCPTGGKPVAWPGACVSYSLQRAASRHASLAEAQILSAEAFGAWQAVRCPGSGLPPSISATDAFGYVSCAQHEYDRSGANANVIVFRDDTWPYSTAEDALGFTAMSFDRATGNVLDADIEINGTAALSTGDVVAPDGFDLLSILTHEAGHFLGLAHSNAQNATMQPVFAMGTEYRTLSDDDIAGICAIYPPGRTAEPCDFTPHGGFSPECALGVVKGGCSVGSAGRSGSDPLGLSAVALVLVVPALRRLRRRDDSD